MVQKNIFDSQQDRLNDNYVQASFSYWNSLLTINGLILTFFSADIFLSVKDQGLLTSLLVFLCVISIVLILLNHRSIRNFYFDNASLTIEKISSLTPVEKESIMEKDLQQFRNRKNRDSALEILMFSEAVILFLMVVSK